MGHRQDRISLPPAADPVADPAPTASSTPDSLTPASLFPEGALFQAFWSHASEAALLVDSAGMIVNANPAAESLLGCRDNQVRTRPLRQMMLPHHPWQLPDGDSEHGLPDGYAVATVSGCDGSRRAVEYRIHALRDDESEGDASHCLYLVLARPCGLSYQAITGELGGIAFQLDLQFRPQVFCGQVEVITGYTEQEFLSGSIRWEQIVHEDDRHLLLPEDRDQLCRQAGFACQREYRILRKNGGTAWVSVQMHNVADAEGRPVLIQGTVADVSERRLAQKESRQTQRALRALLDASLDAMLLTTPDGTVLEFNQQVLSDLQADPSRFRGSYLYDWLPTPLVETRRHYLRQAVESRQLVEYCSERDGRQVRVLLNPVLDEEGCVSAVAMYISDITQQLLIERERDMTVRLLQLVDGDIELRVLARETTAILHDYTGCEAVGIRLKDGQDYPYFETAGFPAVFVEKENYLCAHDADGAIITDCTGNPVLECMCGHVLQGRTNPELPFFTRKGSFWTNSTSKLLAATSEADRQGRTRNRCHGEGYESVALVPLRAGGETLGLLQLNDQRPDRFSIDMITQLERLAGSLAMGLARRKTVDELRESEERYRQLVDVAPVAILAVRNRKLVFANSRLAEMMGHNSPDDVIGADILADVVTEDRPKLLERLRQDELRIPGKPLELRVIRRDGSIVLTESTSVPITLNGRSTTLVILQDITERRRVDRLRAEAGKLASTGRMAARVAHEINNPLAGIKNAFHLIKDAVPAGHPDRDMVDRIDAEISRIAHIVRQTYTLHSPGAEKVRPQSIGHVIDDVLLLLEPLRREQAVDFQLTPVPENLIVNLPESGLHQILFNLVTNAVEASQPLGVVEISASLIGRFVLVSIKDHGGGIPENLRHRIFEPFFTTKGRNVSRAGMGLGLSIVRDIVHSFAGRLELDSTPGVGTEFRVIFPVGGTTERETELR